MNSQKGFALLSSVEGDKYFKVFPIEEWARQESIDFGIKYGVPTPRVVPCTVTYTASTEPKDNSPLTPFGEVINKALEQDWEGVARAFAEGDIRWHMKEWEAFVTKIREGGYQAGRKAAMERFDYLLITSMPSSAENLATITPQDAKITLENLLKALSTEGKSK